MQPLSIETKISLLRHSELLHDASVASMASLASVALEINYLAGHHIIHQGDISNDFYFIAEGEVEVIIGSHQVKVLQKGDVFGLYPLADSKERSADIIAKTETKVLKLNGEDFIKAAASDASLLKGLASEISYTSRDLLTLHQTIANQRDEIEKQKTELAQLNVTKDKLFSIMGHDLRSPVASIITLIEILLSDLDSMANSDLRAMLNDISQLSQIHLKLLENLLQWSRLHTGVTRISPDPIELSEIVEDALSMCEYRFKSKQLSFSRDLEYRSTFRADKNMIQTILRNLLLNAAKFTPRGGSVTIRSRKVNTNEIEISVSDTGIGMSPRQVERLFKLDQVQSCYGTENEAGTGLGLIICHDFVEKNGGRISVESTENIGSTFTITLPLS